MEVKICEECGVHNDINNYECESCGYDLTYTFATDLSKVDKENNCDEEEVRNIPVTVCMPKEKTLVNTNDGHSIVVPINGFKISPGVETVLLEEDKLTIADLEFIIES